MSDLANPLNVFDFTNVSERDVILSVIRSCFMADYGIVRTVSGNKTVDVEHAVLSVTRPGVVADARVLPAIVTKNVELLFPVMGGLSISGTVKVGDGVLLVGLRDLVPTTLGITAASQPPEFWHYSQQTLKAIPLSAIKATSIQFGEENGKAFLRNQTASLFTVLNNFLSDVNSFATTSSSATTAPQIAAAAATLVSALSSVTTALAALLEA